MYHFQNKILHLLAIITWPIPEIWGTGAYFGAYVAKKRAFCLLAFPKEMLFFTIFNKFFILN